MNSRLLFLIPVLLFFQTGLAQETDRKLEKKIQEIVQGFHGEIGVFVLHVPSGKTVSYHADTIFPTASMVKIPILVGVIDKMQRGELDYHQELTYKDSLLYPGVDILGSFKQDSQIELSKLLMLMLTTSDNTASFGCNLWQGQEAALICFWTVSGWFIPGSTQELREGRKTERCLDGVNPHPGKW